MSSHKAPSAGQKVHVHPAKNAPTTTEGTGSIASDSLAAESIRSGGEFSSNPGANTSNIGSGPTETRGQSKPGASGQPGANNPDSLTNQKSYAGPAPTYAEAQTLKLKADGGRPHGKNLEEGGFSGPAEVKGGFPEPGSRDDPGREALKGFVSGEGGVRRNTAKGVDNEQPFGALKETSA